MMLSSLMLLKGYNGKNGRGLPVNFVVDGPGERSGDFGMFEGVAHFNFEFHGILNLSICFSNFYFKFVWNSENLIWNEIKYKNCYVFEQFNNDSGFSKYLMLFK